MYEPSSVLIRIHNNGGRRLEGGVQYCKINEINFKNVVSVLLINVFKLNPGSK
jgi:hypothetical protein